MAEDLLEHLLASEQEWRSTDPGWNRKLRQWEQWKLNAKDRERSAHREKKRKEALDEAEPVEAKEHSWESSFDPEEPSPQFSFAGTRSSYSGNELEADLRWSHTKPWVIEALRRGIAVHHAGMNKKYRSLVER